MSAKMTLNKEDGLKILKGAGIAAGGAVATYLLQILPNVDLGEYTAVIVAIASILINAGLKFIRGNDDE
jgi:Mg2+/citrate symporter